MNPTPLISSRLPDAHLTNLRLDKLRKFCKLLMLFVKLIVEPVSKINSLTVLLLRDSISTSTDNSKSLSG
jgi:hypothetical protein